MLDYESRYYETLSELDTATSELAEYKKAEVQLRKDLADVKARLTSAEESFAQSEEAIAIGTFVAQLAEREAEIAQLRGAIGTWERCEPNELQDAEAGLIACMSKPPSTSYLKQWEKEKYGEPVAWLATSRFMLDSYAKRKTNYVHINDIVQTPLYARKEK